MCYLVRHHATESKPGETSSPPSLGLRPRWAGALAFTLVGGLAVAAALVTAPAEPPRLQAKAVGAPAPLRSEAVTPQSVAVPTSAVVERTALPADDGVPTSSDVAKSGMGECHHGL